MKISTGISSPVQQIKDRLSIEEVISSYIKLDQSGANFKARCPFHNEKTPSFFVSKERGNYYCFGCAAKGDIFTFVQQFEGLDFKGALKMLADRAGIKLSEFSKEKEGEKDRLYRVMEEATKFFENNLVVEKDALSYLKTRGLEEKSIKDFRIGYVKQDWRLLHLHLQKKGFSDVEMEKAGLVKKTDKGFYDRFRGRIMFPINDSSGRVIAFTGRLFIDDGKSAKYLNSPDTPIFSKSSILYGLDKAKESIRKNNFSILVEGQMDLILSHQAGFRNTVATSGTALADSTVSKENVVSNLGLLRRLSSNIVLAFDSDKAGYNASTRAGKIALSFGMDVKVVFMPDGVDPADLISKTGVDAWRSAIRSSKHIIEFLLDKVLSNYADDTRKAYREIREKVLPFVDALSSSMEKSSFLKKVSDKTGVTMNFLIEDLSKIAQEFKNEKEEIEKAKEVELKFFRKDYIERRLLGIIFWQNSLQDKVIDTDQLLKDFSEIFNLKQEDVLSKNKDNKEDLIFEAEVFYGGDVDLKKDTEELLMNLKEEHLKEELFEKMKELSVFEENKEFEKSKEILFKINEINKSIQNIKNGRKN
jgi:DNA primase